jgi:hypothetical protein
MKREPVKWLRDKMKSSYKQKEPCYICGQTELIELHHLYSVSELWNTWISKNAITIESDEHVVLHREQFFEDNKDKLTNDVLYSLCKKHHLRLHYLFGQTYSNFTAERVRSWLEKQKNGEGINGEGSHRLVSR